MCGHYGGVELDTTVDMHLQVAFSRERYQVFCSIPSYLYPGAEGGWPLT